MAGFSQRNVHIQSKKPGDKKSEGWWTKFEKGEGKQYRGVIIKWEN